MSEKQIQCNIATLFPKLAKTCFKKIARMERESTAEAVSPEVDSTTGVGGFTQEETDELYQEVREQVRLEKQMLESETVCNFYGLNEDGAGTLNALP